MPTGRKETVEFHCVRDCSQCCIEREYFPSKEFGKIGVLLLPEERARMETLARKKGIRVKILPRVGVSGTDAGGPTRILAYQMMGREADGNVCPFLDTGSEGRAEHGGYLCGIYGDRPLACSAYPLVGTDPPALDDKCKFCREFGGADKNLDSEEESLIRIKAGMDTDQPVVWRYATGVGEAGDMHLVRTGWMRDPPHS